MFPAGFPRRIVHIKRHLTVFSRQKLVTPSKTRFTKDRCINTLTGINGGKRNCSTFIFQIQHTGQSPTLNSICTCRQNLERFTINSSARVSGRCYHHNKDVRNTNVELPSLKCAFGLVLGSLVCLGLGVYKLKTEAYSCDYEEQPSPQATLTGEGRRSINLNEAIDRSRDLARRIKDESGSPGLAISVSVDGQEVWSEGLGYADVENRVPCSADSVLRIASISKSITMVAVAKQLEAGTLDLDKPVQHYVPNFPEKTVNGKKVTITTRHLVSHLGGIRHYHTKASIPKVEANTQTTKTSKPGQKTAAEETSELSLAEYLISTNYKSVTESLNLFKDDPLVHEPGSKYLYTTYGFTLLSAVLEAVAKTPFEKMMQKYIIEMGMDDTFLDENTPIIYNRGRHYMKNKRGRLINTPYVDLSYKWAGGGFLSTTRDLIKFGHVMLYSYQQGSDTKNNQNRGQSSKANSNSKSQKSKAINTSNQEDKKSKATGFLKGESVQLLWEPVVNTKSSAFDKFGYYGMGWDVVPEGENFRCCHQSDHIVSHTGGAVGGSSVLVIKPKKCDIDSDSHGEPQGVVVAMIVNMTAVSLYKTAVKIIVY
ncbi:Serine beta-lactamase-like protein LACTB, mitochondrial [Mizuhopecten yessoensis]|uniref:Serine beta-lactamase-like protein LACTB, mitochondrial n=1 Tax=Mizuhopecten yessoensis TaxID=6573 RepID=A0A210PXS4_MIZYE|nr:Serine beta-lactamase-like protein LACTB, mitochondrial [Mizuhopecten yessoensis]